jgi:hypothetical protein
MWLALLYNIHHVVLFANGNYFQICSVVGGTSQGLPDICILDGQIGQDRHQESDKLLMLQEKVSESLEAHEWG